MCIHFSLSFGSKPRAKERTETDLGEQLARRNLVPSRLLSFPTGNSKKAMGTARRQNLPQSSLLRYPIGIQKSTNLTTKVFLKTCAVIHIRIELKVNKRLCRLPLQYLCSLVPGPDQRKALDQIFGNSLPGEIWSNPLLSFPIGNSKKANSMRLPKFREQLAGKIWSDPLCCYFQSITARKH